MHHDGAGYWIYIYQQHGDILAIQCRMIFKKNPKKNDLQNVKNIELGGFKFTIRKINPLLDFTADTMPQIFTAYLTRRKFENATTTTVEQLQRANEDMKSIIMAGLVTPKLVPVGKGDARGREDGITVEDLFRDEDMAVKLYVEIFTHSLNRFKGLKGLFFSIKIKHTLFTEWRKNMAVYQAQSLSAVKV